MTTLWIILVWGTVIAVIINVMTNIMEIGKERTPRTPAEGVLSLFYAAGVVAIILKLYSETS